MKDELAIEVRDLVKTFPMTAADGPSKLDSLRPVRRARRGTLTVLDGISFEIERGGFVGIVGPNGCGKSTLVRLLANIYAPDSGVVRVRGRVAPMVELGVGFNYEHSARTNVLLGGVMMGLKREEVKPRIDEVLERAGVAEFAEMPLKNFSSGMRTRLAFSVSVLASPDILLLDEVLAVGDRAFQEGCLDQLQERRDGGATVILVSHSLDKVARYCDRTLLLNHGRIEADGSPDEVARVYHLSDAHRPARGGPAAEDGDGPRLRSLRLVGPQTDSVAPRAPIAAEAVITPVPGCRSGIRVALRDADGTVLFSSTKYLDAVASPTDSELSVTIRLENPLAAGEYELTCSALALDDDSSTQSSRPGFVPLLVSGAAGGAGKLALECEIEFGPAENRAAAGR